MRIHLVLNIVLIVGILCKKIKHEEKQKDDQKIVIEAKEPHKDTLIWLHSLNSNLNEIKELFEQKDTPISKNTRVILIIAPKRFITAYNTTGVSWFDVKQFGGLSSQQYDEYIDNEQMEESAKRIQQVMDEEIQDLGGDSTKLYLGGESQGCCMSLHCGLSYPKQIGGIICFNGFLMLQTQISQEAKKTPVRLYEGTLDQKIPLSLSVETNAVLQLSLNNFQAIILESPHFIDYPSKTKYLKNFFKKINKLKK